MDWSNKFEKELNMAAAARERGNEGQARVCARRAAGAVVHEYFVRLEHSPISPSAMDLLNDLLKQEELPSEARQAAERLKLRVTEEFNLPENIDLLQEARILASSLLHQD